MRGYGFGKLLEHAEGFERLDRLKGAIFMGVRGNFFPIRIFESRRLQPLRSFLMGNSRLYVRNYWILCLFDCWKKVILEVK